MTHPDIAKGRVLVVPGVYDVLSAKMAHHVGFHSAVLTGYGVAASYLGQPDFGLLTQSEILDVARRILNNVNIRLIVDGDTGYGGPVNVTRMVEELLRMGAGGVLLEDQQWPKRCGHMAGKRVIEAEEHAEKIRAAVAARGRAPFLITARTDALATHGIDEAIRRAHLYKKAGADVLFVEGPKDLDQLGRIGSELPPPLAVNLIEGGQTPIAAIGELADMGFISVGFVLSGLYASAHALKRTYSTILAEGSTDSIREHMFSFPEFNEFIGADGMIAEDAARAPEQEAAK